MVKIAKITDNFFKSRPVLKAIKLAADNPILFSSATTFTLSAIIRPAVILATPNTDKNDKKYAIAKSLTSSGVGLGLSYFVSKPVEKAIKAIDKNPSEFLNPTTIKKMTKNGENILKSKKYLFSTQFFKTSVGLLTAFPKSSLTCAILPFVANTIDRDKNNISFSGQNPLAKRIGKAIDSKCIQKLADKFSNTNLVQNMSAATDILLTATFINKVHKNEKIPTEDKKPLINNSIFSTGLSILTTAVLNKISDKHTEKFINYFLNLNKNLKNPQQYAQGIKTIKTIFVMGGVYYAVIPFFSTLLASAVKSLEKKTS